MNDKLTLELKEDKILDILMHAATREDLAKLSAETKADIARLSSETKTDIAKLSTEISTVRSEMGGLRSELKSDILRLDNKLDKIVWFIIASILIPVVMHFMK